jgi:hypothetical protein
MTVTANSPIADLKLSAVLTKNLAGTGYATVAQLVRTSREAVTGLWFTGPTEMAAIDKALASAGLRFAPSGGAINVCKTCPACPVCGSLRATSAVNVVTDSVTGQARHGGFQPTPPCANCNVHHRALVADRAAELAGV